MENIILIGMPGVGKSTLGVILAKLIGYRFLDTDLIIQEKCGTLLKNIIENEGVDGFIETENRICAGVNASKAVIATGGSAVDAINAVKARGGKKITFMCIIAAPEGLEALQAAHPDVPVYIGALDEKLNDHKYIVPGLGDAGDRIFGTK